MKKFLILIGLLATFSVTTYVSICNTEAKVRTMQRERVCFTVVDERGDPIIGATAKIKGTTVGATSDVDGQICIDVTKGQTIELSAIGYKTIEFVYIGQRPGRVTLRVDY